MPLLLTYAKPHCHRDGRCRIRGGTMVVNGTLHTAVGAVVLGSPTTIRTIV